MDAQSRLKIPPQRRQCAELVRANPFPEKPPRYVRAIWYRYKFAPPNSAGVWWEREQLGIWLPPLSADMPELREVLRAAQWLPPEIDEVRPDPR